MDELLGIPMDELACLAESLDQAPTQSSRSTIAMDTTSKSRCQQASAMARLDLAGGMSGLRANIVTVDLGVTVGDTVSGGLGLFASRSFARGEVLFTERPQVAVAAPSTSCRHCGWCLRSLVGCPAGLPNSEFWPVLPRATACARCATPFCCSSCAALAHRAGGHQRLCDAIATGRLETFHRCCREIQSGLSADPRLSTAAASLALTMMAHLATPIDDGADGAPQPDGALSSGGVFSHLSRGGGDDGEGGGEQSATTLAARLHPLIRAVLQLTESECCLLDEACLRRVLRMIASNATWIHPVSAFADYVSASRSMRRRDTTGATLRHLEKHCEALRERLTAEDRLDGGERPDEVADAEYGAGGAVLFKLQSKINHSCEPCAKLVAAFTDATIDVVAEQDIAEGTEISISYVNPALDRTRRRQMLRTAYGFSCTCARCTRDGNE